MKRVLKLVISYIVTDLRPIQDSGVLESDVDVQQTITQNHRTEANTCSATNDVTPSSEFNHIGSLSSPTSHHHANYWDCPLTTCVDVLYTG